MIIANTSAITFFIVFILSYNMYFRVDFLFSTLPKTKSVRKPKSAHTKNTNFD